MRWPVPAALIAILGIVGAAAARNVDYAALTPEKFASEAERLKIAPISPLPDISARPLFTIRLAAALKHETLALGNYCAVAVTNDVAAMMQKLVEDLKTEQEVAATGPEIIIALSQARSYRRCIEVAEMNIRCITTVMLVGSKWPDSAAAKQISVRVERDSSVGGFCENVARGVGIVTREAGQQFLAAALAD